MGNVAVFDKDLKNLFRNGARGVSKLKVSDYSLNTVLCEFKYCTQINIKRKPKLMTNDEYIMNDISVVNRCTISYVINRSTS